MRSFTFIQAMIKMIKHLMRLIEDEEAVQEGPHLPSSLNFSVSDGVVVIATRFRDSTVDDQPPSLYWSECHRVRLKGGRNKTTLRWNHVVRRSGGDAAATTASPEKQSAAEEVAQDEVESVIVASEPLFRKAEAWNLVPRNTLLTITPKYEVILEPIELEGVEIKEVTWDKPEPHKPPCSYPSLLTHLTIKEPIGHAVTTCEKEDKDVLGDYDEALRYRIHIREPSALSIVTLDSVKQNGNNQIGPAEGAGVITACFTGQQPSSSKQPNLVDISLPVMTRSESANGQTTTTKQQTQTRTPVKVAVVNDAAGIGSSQRSDRDNTRKP